jgi:hypothetical protein
MYAILAIDLDNRLNVNAHGLVDHIGLVQDSPGSYRAVPPALETGLLTQTGGAAYSAQPLANFDNGPNLAGMFSSQVMPNGIGYGPAEISLRPVFPAPWTGVDATTGLATGYLEGNHAEDSNANGSHQAGVDDPVDSYATVLIGRDRTDLTSVAGKWGFEYRGLLRPIGAVTPGINYQRDDTTGYDRSPVSSSFSSTR